ncbi:MAG: GFA family protein [Cyanobacteria bacterium]|nr:GFA family protein [Cyanobacteriota bacterium]
MAIHSTESWVVHRGGCHCGRVRFEVDAPAAIAAVDCNCSLCQKTGYLHLIVSRDRFRLLQGRDALTTYTFNTHTAQHLFCATCGIKSFYVPRSHPDGYSVNVRCLDPGTIADLQIQPFDGQNWEDSIEGLRDRDAIETQ